MRIGYHVGAVVDVPISNMFSFETGLMLSTKGYKQETEVEFFGETIDTEVKMNLLYLDIPLTGKILYDLGKAKIYGSFGPHIGLGLSGKAKTEVSQGGTSDSDEIDVEWGSDDDDNLRRFDFVLTIGAGVEFNSIVVGVTYGLGQANLAPSDDGGTNIKNRVIGIAVGYNFGL